MNFLKRYICQCKYPMPLDSKFNHKTHREQVHIKFKQFLLNVAHARTVNKSKGKSIRHLVVATWDYTDNRIYLVLSWCKTLKGLFIMEPLNYFKTKGMSEDYIQFHKEFKTLYQHFKNGNSIKIDWSYNFNILLMFFNTKWTC